MIKNEVRKITRDHYILWIVLIAILLNIFIIYITKPKYDTGIYQKEIYEMIRGPLSIEVYKRIENEYNRYGIKYSVDNPDIQVDFSDVYITGNDQDEFYLYKAIYEEYDRLLSFNEGEQIKYEQYKEDIYFNEYVLKVKDSNKQMPMIKEVYDYEYTNGVNRLLDYNISFYLALAVTLLLTVYIVHMDRTSKMNELSKVINPMNRFSLVTKLIAIFSICIFIYLVFIGIDLLMFYNFDFIAGWQAPLYQLYNYQNSSVDYTVLSIYIIKVGLNVLLIWFCIYLMLWISSINKLLIKILCCLLIVILYTLGTLPFNYAMEGYYIRPNQIPWYLCIWIITGPLLVLKVGKKDEAYFS